LRSSWRTIQCPAPRSSLPSRTYVWWSTTAPQVECRIVCRCRAQKGGPVSERHRVTRLLAVISAFTAQLPAANASTLLTFDQFAHATALSTEFKGLGVVLGSTAPLGPTLSPDPADSLQPGQSVAPFVFAIVAVPSASTPTPPNKVIGAVWDAGGGLLQC